MLRPVDLVGVLIFEQLFPMDRTDSQGRGPARRLSAWGGHYTDGGTQIAPALSEAFRDRPAARHFQHIVLLTMESLKKVIASTSPRKHANERVTISTVGLGQDVNRAYLEKIAAMAKAKSYFLNDSLGWNKSS